MQPYFTRDGAKVRQLGFSPAPRRVTVAAYLRTVLGVWVQVGLGLACFGSLFLWIFVAQSEVFTWVEFRGPTAIVEGEVTATRSSSAKENKSVIYESDYSYSVDGRPFTGRSFGAPARVGAAEIEYLKERPEVSRVVGMRRRPFGEGTVFFTIPLLLGLTATVIGIVVGVRATRVLSRGALGFAKLVEKKDTGSRVNGSTVFAFLFELELPEDAPAAYRAGCQAEPKKHRFTFKGFDASALEDEPLEPVFYDPSRPGSGIPLDGLGLVVGPSGAVHTDAWPITRLILPALLVAVTVFGVLLRT